MLDMNGILIDGLQLEFNPPKLDNFMQFAMSGAYSSVRGGQLKLKGGSGSQLKKKKKKRKRGDSLEGTFAAGDLRHGKKTWVGGGGGSMDL